MRYFDALCDAMKLCEAAGGVFMGQAVAFPGTAMSTTLKDVDRSKLVELPVAEEMQLGMATGVSLAGGLPITLYPRWNFLLLATNQLINHLDKLPRFSEYRPKVLIRTAVATSHPLNPGPQHLGDFSYPFKCMLDTVAVAELTTAESIVPAYQKALDRDGSTLLVEYSSLYGT